MLVAPPDNGRIGRLAVAPSTPSHPSPRHGAGPMVATGKLGPCLPPAHGPTKLLYAYAERVGGYLK